MIYYYLRHTWHWLVVGMLAIVFSKAAASPTSYANFSSDSITRETPASMPSPEVPNIDFSNLNDYIALAPSPKPRNINIYDLPYSTTANYPN